MDILNDANFLKDLNQTLKNGGVIAFVTDTVWGIGCLPTNKKAVDKIYEIKGRDRSKPLILMSNDIQNLYPYVENVSDTAKNLIEKHFPGALTLIFEKSEKTLPFITSNQNTVGVRVPDNQIFKKLCGNIDGNVLATTSANLSNQTSAKTYEEAQDFIGAYVDYVIKDFGYEAKGLESTVALATTDDIKILRQGAVIIE